MNNEILILENQQVIMNTLACFIGNIENDSYDDLKKQFEKTNIIVHPENKPTLPEKTKDALNVKEEKGVENE